MKQVKGVIDNNIFCGCGLLGAESWKNLSSSPHQATNTAEETY